MPGVMQKLGRVDWQGAANLGGDDGSPRSWAGVGRGLMGTLAPK